MSSYQMAASASVDISDKIIKLLHRFRRVEESLKTDTGEACEPTSCAACYEAHRAKLDYFIRRSEQIHFVLPAFPAKSANQTKVLGALPDLGESMALSFLQSLCDYIGYFYRPGARVTICSDGHVFSDVVAVPLASRPQGHFCSLAATAASTALVMLASVAALSTPRPASTPVPSPSSSSASRMCSVPM